jgi:hypothetical protein
MIYAEYNYNGLNYLGYKRYFEYLGKFDFEKDDEVLNSNLHIAIDVGDIFGLWENY